jgi:Tol biopolymer transport system component
MDFPGGRTQLNVYDFQEHSRKRYSDVGAEGQFSPDSQWVAFTGPGSGPLSDNYQDAEISVPKFPITSGRIQISNHGGAQPRWRGDGKELYFISGDKKLMAVSIDTPMASSRQASHMSCFRPGSLLLVSSFQYEVSPDGKRFLINSLPSFGAAPVTVLAY